MSAPRKPAMKADDTAASPATPLELTESPSPAQVDGSLHDERKALGMSLLHTALRLQELGCMNAGGKVLDAAVKLCKLKPGKVY